MDSDTKDRNELEDGQLERKPEANQDLMFGVFIFILVGIILLISIL